MLELDTILSVILIILGQGTAKVEVEVVLLTRITSLLAQALHILSQLVRAELVI